jgi:ABC-type multidrug transport system permease subunit
MRSPVIQVALMRLRETFRQPEIIFWAFVFPTLLAAVLGVAFRERTPAPVPAAVARTAGHEAAADSLAAALNAGALVRAQALDPEAAALALRAGKVDIVVVPGAAGATAGNGERPAASVPPFPPVTYRYDPARAEGPLALAVVDAALQRAAGRVDPLPTEAETVSEPGSRYVDFLVPGLLGMNLLSGGLWGLGWAIVEMRTKRLLKRFTASPMRRADFVLGQMLARAVFTPLETAALLGLTHWLFGVPVRGSLLDLTILVAFGTACFSALGALVASRAQTMETASGLVNLTQMPMLVMSGVFFATSRFPEAMQPFIHALPLTATNDVLRAVMLEGQPLAAQGGELLVLAVWGVASFVGAVKLFRWT